jgi:CheY-like chemotaxis protein
VTRLLLVASEASLCTLIQEVLALERYTVVEAANSYEGLSVPTAALPAGTLLDIRYLVIF